MPSEILSYEQFINFDQQIKIFKQLGIRFELTYSEERAREYLKNNNSFYRLSSYCDSFEREQPDDAGRRKYEQLDFQHLVDLSIIDFRLREVLLHLVIHIEHHLKIELNRLLRLHDIDPCAVVKKFSKNSFFRNYPLWDRLCQAGSSDYSRDIYEETKPNVPVWVMLELLQLGELKAFVGFLRESYRFPDQEDQILYNLDYELSSARSLRNAAAHNSGILNGLLQVDERKLARRVYDVLFEAETADDSYLFTEEELEDSRLSCALKDISTALFLHHDLVTSPGVKKSMAERLHELKVRFSKRIKYDPRKAVGFSLGFIERLIELWHPLAQAEK